MAPPSDIKKRIFRLPSSIKVSFKNMHPKRRAAKEAVIQKERPSSSSEACTNSISALSKNFDEPGPEQKKGDDSILKLCQRVELSGTAKPGSHSACFRLTPNGTKHEPTYPDLSELDREEDVGSMYGRKELKEKEKEGQEQQEKDATAKA